MLRKLFYTKTKNDRYEDVKLTLAVASVFWYGGERYIPARLVLQHICMWDVEKWWCKLWWGHTCNQHQTIFI